jgi:hypothetical protein
MRTDGRNNNLAKYQPNYGAGQWGYRFSSIHATAPALCDGTKPTQARWVYKFGQWIDNQMPRDTGTGLFTANFDSFHPTVSSGLIDAQCGLSNLRVGFWDDSGSVSRIEIFVNGQSRAIHSALPNGSVIFPLSGMSSSDSLKVLAEDSAGNRQSYEKSLDELVIECQVASGIPTPTPTPSPTPTMTPTPTPSPSPTVTSIPTMTSTPTATPTPTPTSGSNSVNPEPTGTPAQSPTATPGGGGGGTTPTPTPIPGSASLSVQPSAVIPGNKATFNVSGAPSNASSFNLYCTTNGVNPGAATGALALNGSKLLKRTGNWPAFPLLEGNGGLRVTVPYSTKLIGKTVSCQIQVDGVSAFSNVASFSIKPTKNVLKSLLKLAKAEKTQRAQAEKCKAVWKKSKAKYASKSEIPVCIKANRSKLELKMGKALIP